MKSNTVKLILRNNIDERLAHRNKASDKASYEAINQVIGEALTEDEKTIIVLIKADPGMSQKKISETTGFSRSKIQRIMKKLSDEHVIYREGAKKKGFWRVMYSKKGNNNGR